MRELILTPEAFEDLRTASRWYEQQRTGLSAAFQGAIGAALAHIQRSPRAFREIVAPFRRTIVKRYPYDIYYEFDDSRVLVVLIFHTARNPDEVLRRLGRH